MVVNQPLPVMPELPGRPSRPPLWSIRVLGALIATDAPELTVKELMLVWAEAVAVSAPVATTLSLPVSAVT